MQVAFFLLAEEITQVKEAIPWVRCASGNVLCCLVANSLFYGIYAVLSQNLFCRDLRALAWRKIGPNILSVEKKGQISGMSQRNTH